MNTLIKDLKYVDKVRTQMNENGIMLCYRGEISQDIVIALLNLAENKLTQDNKAGAIKTRVFSVMVECLQNITQHSEKNEYAGSNIFMIGQADKGYAIYSGNVIKSDKVKDLQAKILKINTMNDDELKEFYKYLIQNGSIMGNTCSGMGLIQIARKTGNPLDFGFEKIDNECHFFSLKTIVNH